MDAEVYMQQPEGFVQKDKTWVCKLLKSIYGLKQSSRLWQEKLDDTLVTHMGFTRIISDNTVWVYLKDGVRVFVPIFVNDITVAANDKAKIADMKSELKKHFKFRDLGPTTFLMGVEVIRDRSKRTIQLSQKQYILEILERHGMSDCTPVLTALDSNIRLHKMLVSENEKQEEYARKFPYMNAIGELLYLAIATRPDIGQAVSHLARFGSKPSYAHCKAVQRLWRYLKGTIDCKLTYAPDGSTSELFVTYSDADFAGCKDTGKSTSGYLVKMGTGAISWMSKLQPIIALSTTEAEYVAAVSAGQEIVWLRKFFAELGYDKVASAPSTLKVDNQSAMSVAKNPQHQGRMKHLDIRFYWLRNKVKKRNIKLEYVPTAEMPADLLTKPLPAHGTQKFRAMMGVL